MFTCKRIKMMNQMKAATNLNLMRHSTHLYDSFMYNNNNQHNDRLLKAIDNLGLHFNKYQTFLCLCFLYPFFYSMLLVACFV